MQRDSTANGAVSFSKALPHQATGERGMPAPTMGPGTACRRTGWSDARAGGIFQTGQAFLAPKELRARPRVLIPVHVLTSQSHVSPEAPAHISANRTGNSAL